jgi:hypothetical protein
LEVVGDSLVGSNFTGALHMKTAKNISVVVFSVSAAMLLLHSTVFAQAEPPIPQVACVNNEVHLIWRDYQFKVIITGIACQHTGDTKWQLVLK